MRILGVILAGGRGERMGGRNKALVDVAGRPLIDWVIERARPQVDTLVLNANADQDTLAQHGLTIFSDTIVPGISDEAAREGPLAGIVAGLTFAQSAGDYDAVATFAVDTPLFPNDLVLRLAEAVAHSRSDFAIAVTREGEHPVFGLWKVQVANRVAQIFGEGVRAPRMLGSRLKQAVVRFDDPDAFANANSPEEAEKLSARLSR